MTKDDILKAAFKVWGRDLYRTTSLTDIALELGVSKPALYRHFKDKEALLDTMYTAYLDDCAAFIKNGCDEALNAPSSYDSHLIMIRTIGEYFIRNGEAFAFSLIQVYNNRKRKHIDEEFRTRGVDFWKLAHREGHSDFYPSRTQLVMSSLIYSLAQFHRQEHRDDDVGQTLAQIEERIKKGMGLDAQKVASLNYEALEQQRTAVPLDETEENALLKAVAGAVAEAGPWDASMEMVAKRSGLSKSGLYAHFKNKQDMISQLFITEFLKIVNYAKGQIETSEVHEEQLYLAIISIVDYLRSRPEILVAIDWIKTRRLGLAKEVPIRLYRVIEGIKFEAIRMYDRHLLVWAAQWILFMIVNTLALWPMEQEIMCAGQEISKVMASNATKIPIESYRILFRFIALGLEGLN